MTRQLIFATALFAALSVRAAWYWPFGSGSRPEKRLSVLMEPASTNIDAAIDFIAEGKRREAEASFRRALDELDRIERENPLRADSPEFASVRNKRAYVSAQIDAMMLGEARENAKSVAVTDTTELEKRFLELENPRRPTSERPEENRPKMEKQVDRFLEQHRERVRDVKMRADRRRADDAVSARVKELLEDDPDSRQARLLMAGEAVRKGRHAEARRIADKLVAEQPEDARALNMKGVCQILSGDAKGAGETFERAMAVAPEDYRAYYNMANLKLRAGDRAAARRYYREGLSAGGVEDPGLEEALK